MPFSATQIRCRVDPDVDEALFNFQERLGEQYLQAQAVLTELETIRASVESGLTDPLRSSLDQVLAVADTSVEEMEDTLGLVVTGTTEDVESSIADRYGINVVNGRVIPDGELDISAMQVLSRLVGRIEDILTYIPELEGLPIDVGSDRLFRELTEFSPRFLLVSTYLKTTVVPATKCSAEITIEEEITAGVEIPLSAAASASGVAKEDLRIYIFWLGPPSAGARLRNKARSMGLTNAQFVDAVSLRSSDNFIVSKIDDPMDIIRLIAAFGGDVDAVLDRVTGPIELFEDPRQVLESIRDTFGRSSGASSPQGFRDLSSPSASLLSVIDVDKTFNLKETFNSLRELDSGASLAETQFILGLAGALESQLLALTSILKQSQELLQGLLTNLSNLQSITFNVFNDLDTGLLNCMFGAGFSPSASFPNVGTPSAGVGGIGGSGTPGIPGVPTANPLEDLLSTIEGQSGLIRQFTSSLNAFFGAASSISCSGSFLTSALGAAPSFPGTNLNCRAEQLIDQGFEIPEAALDVMGVVQEVMDFVTGLFDFSISNMRNLRLTALSMSGSLRQTVESRSSVPSIGTAGGGCGSPEASRLAAVLQRRATAAFSSAGGL